MQMSLPQGSLKCHCELHQLKGRKTTCGCILARSDDNFIHGISLVILFSPIQVNTKVTLLVSEVEIIWPFPPCPKMPSI